MDSHWIRSDAGGRAVDWFDPPAKPRFALLYLHPIGGESLAGNAVFTAELRRLNLACCAPQGGERWWADHEELLKLHPAMRDRWILSSKAIAVAGISMGGQGALRLAFQNPESFNVVAGIASAIDHHERFGQGSPLDSLYRSREACRQDTATLRIRPDSYPKHIWFACDPTDDEWFRGNDRLDEKLTAMGIPHTADLTTEAGGHSWNYFEAMAAPMLQFVVKSLEADSRRLL